MEFKLLFQYWVVIFVFQSDLWIPRTCFTVGWRCTSIRVSPVYVTRDLQTARPNWPVTSWASPTARSSAAHPSVPTQSATSQSLTCNVAGRSAAWINVHTRQRLKFHVEVANTCLCIAQRTKSSLKVTESFRDNTKKSETFV